MFRTFTSHILFNGKIQIFPREPFQKKCVKVNFEVKILLQYIWRHRYRIRENIVVYIQLLAKCFVSWRKKGVIVKLPSKQLRLWINILYSRVSIYYYYFVDVIIEQRPRNNLNFTETAARKSPQHDCRIYRGWLGQHRASCNTNTRPSFWNTRPSFSNSRPSFWGFQGKLKARLSVWKARSRFCLITRPMLSQSATVRIRLLNRHSTCKHNREFIILYNSYERWFYHVIAFWIFHVMFRQLSCRNVSHFIL